MWKVRSLYLMVILIIFIVCSISIVPALSLNTPTQSIQSQGEIKYPPTPMPQLSVNGLYLEDGLGNRVTLKGVQVTWNERTKKYGTTASCNSPEESWFTIDGVRRIKEAGGNVIEIVDNGLPDLMPTKNIPNEAYFTNWIDKWINWTRQYKIYCILSIRGIWSMNSWAIDLGIPSWLWSGLYSTPTSKADYDVIIRDFFDINATIQDSNRAAFINLWKFIANRYKDNPYMLFGIVNEPFNSVNIPDDATVVHLGQAYSTFMENIVDAIRSTGATQIINIDQPFLWDSQGRMTVQPVNRDNILWEVHAYVASWSPTLDSWKGQINVDIQKFVNEFKKPLFIGEYGFDPISIIRTTYSSTWTTILSNQAAYLDSQQLVGRQWHTWDYLYGEYYDFDGTSDLTAEESMWTIQTVLG